MQEAPNKIKVLLIAGRMGVGGIENQLMHLLRQADKSRFQIDFTTTEDHPFYEEEILSLGGKCIRIPATDGRRFFRYCRALYKVIKDGQYDVVHSHELFHSGMVLLTARLAGVRHRFVHAHSCNQDYGRNWKRQFYHRVMRWLILHNATCFLACSTVSADFLYGEGIRSDPRYHLVVNSVETAQFLPNEATEKQTNSGNEWKTVLQVGRFSHEKNFLLTTEIAGECKKRGDRIRFLFVGNENPDNPVEQTVRERIQAERLQDTVQLLGVRKDVNELMKKADAFILPSKFEGMPLTLIEAQAACLPCVAADTFSHEVDFGVGAVRWIPLDAPVTAWADTLEQAIRQGKTEKACVQKAIEEHGFDTKEFSKRICGLYENAMNEGKH